MWVLTGQGSRTSGFGFVAEVCPKCQQTRAMILYRVSHGSHVFFIPFGRRLTLQYFMQCGVCGSQTWTDASRYPSVAHSHKIPLDQLIAQTNPVLAEGAARAELVRWIHDKLAAPFQQADKKLVERYSNGDSWDLRAFAALLGVPAAVTLSYYFSVFLCSAFHVSGPDVDDWRALTVLPVLVLSLWWLFRELKFERKRFFRKKLLPTVLRELAPDPPTEGDLTELFDRFRRYQYPVAAVTTSAEVWQALKASDATGASVEACENVA